MRGLVNTPRRGDLTMIAALLIHAAVAADLDRNGVDDAREVIGGPSIASLAPAFLDIVRYCPANLHPLGYPDCFPWTFEIYPDYTTEYTAYYGPIGTTWSEGIDAQGSRTFLWESLGERMRGVEVQGAPGQRCYAGLVETTGGYTNAQGQSVRYWFPQGEWEGCLL